MTWAARLGGDGVLADGVATATAAARRTVFPLYDNFDHRHRCAQSRYRWTTADDGEGGGFSIATAMILRTDAGRRRWSSFAAIFRTLISHYPYACCE